MIEKGLIEPPNSDFNAPVAQEWKKDGTNIFCIDLRKIIVLFTFDPESITNKDMIKIF